MSTELDEMVIRSELKDMISKNGSASRVAKKIGVSPSQLCHVLKGDRRPDPAILNYLKIRRTYVRDGSKGEDEDVKTPGLAED